MNNKGFTTVELILTMLLVITIMFSITSVTYVYRDRSVYEEIYTELNDYKNTVTKIIYDDILDSSNKVTKLVKDENNDHLFKLIKRDNSEINLEIIDRNITKNGNEIHEVGIKYNDIEYLIPGSNNSLVNFQDFEIYSDETGISLYVLDIIFTHQSIEEPFKIHFVIQNS